MKDEDGMQGRTFGAQGEALQAFDLAECTGC
jgi:hypothetical protein